jgi:hypothetical protein
VSKPVKPSDFHRAITKLSVWEGDETDWMQNSISEVGLCNSISRMRLAKNKIKLNKDVPRGGSFSEHLAIESMGGRAIPIKLDVHRYTVRSATLPISGKTHLIV